MILYGIYILLTALCIVCLLLGGMPVFDSFCIASHGRHRRLCH